MVSQCVQLGAKDMATSSHAVISWLGIIMIEPMIMAQNGVIWDPSHERG